MLLGIQEAHRCFVQVRGRGARTDGDVPTCNFLADVCVSPADSLQHSQSLMRIAIRSCPSWRLRDKNQGDEEDERNSSADSKNESPEHGRGKVEAEDLREQDTQICQDLRQESKEPTFARRRNFRDVDWNNDHGCACANAGQESSG